MDLLTLNGLLSEEIPSFEEFVGEDKLPPLDISFILDGISSVPVHERLELKKDFLCEEEMQLMNLEAKRYTASFKEKLSKSALDDDDDEVRVYEEELNQVESGYAEDEENVDIFLKYIYNCCDDDFITKIKQNLNFNGVLQDSSSEVQSFEGEDKCIPSKEFSEFLLKTNDGIHDDFVIRETVCSQESSEDSSEEKDETSENLAKELSCKLKFNHSRDTKFLDHIINANKPFNLISESGVIKKPVLPLHNLFQGDSDSEIETDPLKEVQKSKGETVKEQQPNRGKKEKRSRGKKKQKAIVKECNTNLKKNESKSEVMKNSKDMPRAESKSEVMKNTKDMPRAESKSEVLKNSKDMSRATASQCPAASSSNVKGDHTKKNDGHTVNQQSTSSKSAVAGIEVSHAKVGMHKNAKKNKKQETSGSSDDEDWKDLAEKNLLLRSKTLQQKATMKK